MKNFLKYTLATVTGIIISTFLLIILLTVIISVSSRDKAVEVKPNTILYLRLNKTIVDRSEESPFNINFFPGAQAMGETGLNTILENIDKAARDKNISGIWMDLTDISAGYATVKEIRDALVDFKESGKFILAYGDLYTQKAYYLASVAHRIYLNPAGQVLFVGLQENVVFFKDLLTRMGVDIQIIRHGQFKAAVEPFMYNEMSPENREQIMTYLSSIWDQVTGSISESRGIETAELNRIADELILSSAGKAREYKFVDGLRYKDQIIDELKDSTGIEPEKDLRTASLKRYDKAPKIRDKKGFARDKIAVIYAHGIVGLGNSGEGTIGSERISKAIRKARRDSSIKAIVLRVNSGGGSVLASEIIWREAKLARQTKPLVASFGDVAASGGYYIACPADTIVAHPNTITGSIGVFGILPNLKEFFNEKIGIAVDVAKTNEHSDLGNLFRPLNDVEKRTLNQSVEEVYDDFLSRVSEGRNMKKEEVDLIAEGRVWSGMDGLEIGLVDKYGGINKAVEIAAGMSGLEHYRKIELPRLEDPFEQLIRQLTENTRARVFRRELGEDYKYYRQIREIREMSGIQARIPYSIDIR